MRYETPEDILRKYNERNKFLNKRIEQRVKKFGKSEFSSEKEFLEFANKEHVQIWSWNCEGFLNDGNENVKIMLQHASPDILCLNFTSVVTNLQYNQGSDIVDKIKKATIPDCYAHYWNGMPYERAKTLAMQNNTSFGTALITRIKPKKVRFGMDNEDYDLDGRTITAEFSDFVLINVYSPISNSTLQDQDLVPWHKCLAQYVNRVKVETKKPVVLTGNFKVAPD